MEQQSYFNRLRINFFYLAIAVILFLFPFIFYLEMHTNLPYINAYDEVIGIISVIYFVYLAYTKEIVDYRDILISLLCISIVLIGLFGNMLSDLLKGFVPIATDVVCLLKIVFPFLACRYIVRKDDSHYVAKALVPVSKMLIISSAFFGLISLFVDIGMADEKRYGIPAYGFIFKNQGRLGLIVIACLTIVMLCEKRIKMVRLYEGLTFFVIILTTKGSVYVVPAIFIFINWLFKKNKRLSLKSIIVLILIVVLISGFQINTYLADSESPRMTLIKYGFVTAKDYFPLGSGFGTYGSDVAAKNYSMLYVKYGFEHRWGMSRELTSFLNDCYLGMVIGQFGYLGAIIFFIMLVYIYRDLSDIETTMSSIKALCIATFFSHIIALIGSAMIKSGIGVFSFCVIGIASGYMRNESNAKAGITRQTFNKRKLRIHFR